MALDAFLGCTLICVKSEYYQSLDAILRYNMRVRDESEVFDRASLIYSWGLCM